MSSISHKLRVPLLAAAATALVFVVTGSAATGGNFILGQTNSADKTTSLTVNTLPGSSGCPAPCQAFKVTDNSTAANAGGLGVLGKSASTPAATIQNSGGAPALKLVVNSGKTPFTVNSRVEVANLNGDLLDGKDSSYFLATTGTAANSSKLGGLSPTAFWMLGGNAPASTGVLGTTNNQALELKVNGARALRLEPDATSPNVIGGSPDNFVLAGAAGAVIGGGGTSNDTNRVTDSFGSVGGGGNNIAGDNDGGNDPTTAEYATVAGGASNTASGNFAAVLGGSANTASGENSAVGGGHGNLASGLDSFAAGGFGNQANGDYSFAAGYEAVASQDGSFVWADTSGSQITSPAVNTFTVRAAKGIWLGTSSSPISPEDQATPLFIATSTGASLTNAGVWTDSSDRALKHDVRLLNKQSVLQKVARMPITSWSYKVEKPSIRHIGPMAQDFYSAFGLGYDDKHIGTIDEGGVALAAIQGLYRQNRALERRNTALSARVAHQNARLARQNARLTKLERAVAKLSR